MDRIKALRAAMEEYDVEFVRVSAEQVENAETYYGIVFPAVLKEFYLGGMPRGKRFPNWTSRKKDNVDEVRRMLDFPMNSIVAAVDHNEYWTMAWGEQPETEEASVEVAKEKVSQMLAETPLIPLVGHCYLVCNGTEAAGPVLSVFGEEVAVMGDNLIDFFEKRYHVVPRSEVEEATVEACGSWKTMVG